MNKKIILITAMLLVLLMCAFTGCISSGENELSNEAYYTFTDSDGFTVELSKKPQTVAVLFSSLSEAWLNAGGEIAITVGETVERKLCKGEVLLVDSGAGKTVDNERLISLEPDFVICSADIAAQKDTASLLRKAGIPVALIRLDTFEDYLEVLKIFTDITDRKDLYKENGEKVKDEIEKTVAESKKAEGTKVLFIRSGSSVSSAKAKKAEDNFAAKILEDLGCFNIAEKAEILVDSLSAEVILKEDPQYIFISLMGDYENSKGFMESLLQSSEYKNLTAVKNGKVYFLPKELFQYKPCGRWAESYRYISSILNNE